MVASVEERVTRLEAELAELRARLTLLEPEAEPVPTRAAAPPARPSSPPPKRRPVESPAPVLAAAERPHSALDLEELLGGRLLALVGGVAVLVGLAFLVALAVDRGWIGEEARVSLAFAGSLALLGAGVWLAERRGRSQAALATVGTATGGLFLSVTAAGSLYGLVPDVVALAAALGVGALAAALAVRWRSPAVAGLGIGGAMLAPVYASSFPSGEGIAFLAVAFAASAAVLLRERWEWLRVAAFAIAMAQLAVWAGWTAVSPPLLLLALGVFGVIGLALAVGYELRMPAEGLRPSTALLVATNALVVGGTGATVLFDDLGERSAGAWMGALAIAHVLLGAALLRFRPASRHVAYLLLGVSLIAADLAFALLVDGAALAVGWAASAAALAALGRRYGEGELVPVTLAGQLSLAIAHTVLFAPPAGVVGGSEAVPYGPLVTIAAAAFACARLARPGEDVWRLLADATGLVTVAYLTAVTVDGVVLLAAFGAQALALAHVGRRTGDRLAEAGAAGFLALAVGHALAFEAPPVGLVDGVRNLGAAVLALAVVAGVSNRLARAAAGIDPGMLRSLAGGAVLYGASLAIVTAFGPATAGLTDAGALDPSQQGQAVLSAFWTLCGLGLLWAGLRLDRQIVRLYGFALLSLAAAKVFLFDMATLESGWRILSFVVLGLLLLAGAFAYQRLRGNDRDPVLP